MSEVIGARLIVLYCLTVLNLLGLILIGFFVYKLYHPANNFSPPVVNEIIKAEQSPQPIFEGKPRKPAPKGFKWSFDRVAGWLLIKDMTVNG